MNVNETKLAGCFLIENRLFEDQRGYLFEGFNQRRLEELAGIQFEPKQLNQSKSSYGVLRGIHFQNHPKAQAKLVSCIEGEILDVAVDFRKGSPTYGQFVAEKLSDDNKKSLFIPKGMGHGFIVLSKTAKLMYLVDELYSPEHNSGINYADPVIDIDWLIEEPELILSEKDKHLPTLTESQIEF